MLNDLLYAYSAILGERRKEIETVANNFFNINTTNNHRKRHNI
jgi:flagellar basal body rod protein FlgG